MNYGTGGYNQVQFFMATLWEGTQWVVKWTNRRTIPLGGINANVMNWMDVVVVRSKWLRVETINKENGISGWSHTTSGVAADGDVVGQQKRKMCRLTFIRVYRLIKERTAISDAVRSMKIQCPKARTTVSDKGRILWTVDTTGKLWPPLGVLLRIVHGGVLIQIFMRFLIRKGIGWRQKGLKIVEKI